MPTLTYRPGEPDERSFEIGREPLVVGRADEHAISIHDKSLSRSHARIERDGEAVVVVDLSSKNGTFVNGVQVWRRELRHGDALTLGDIAFTFRTAGGEPPPPRPPSAPHLQPRTVRALTRIPIARLVRGPSPWTPIDAGAQTASQPPREAEPVPASYAGDRLRMLMEVAKLLSGREELDPLLGRILDLAFRMLDADRGAVLLIDEETGRLEPRVTRVKQPGGAAPGPPTRAGDERFYSQSILDYVQQKGVAAVFADTALDPRLYAAKSVIFQSIRASMCAPLKPRDEIIGVLYLDNLSTPNCFTEDDLEFMVAFASQAAIAIENVSLYRRVERETAARMALVMEAKVTSLNAMVAGIAHEIRNPLNFIANFAEISQGLLDDVTEGLAEQRGAIGAEAYAALDEALVSLRGNAVRINDHGRKADAIIKAMLLHARQGTADREEADVNALVAESVKLALGARRGGIAVEVAFDRDEAAGAAEIARGEMSRVLVNLLENALYAMTQKRDKIGPPYAPRLDLATAGRGDRVEIRVRDNGTGIPAEIADRIYNPFFTTKPAGEGTGLGLSLSHDIVVLGHQGTLRMESDPGAWCEFTITLPRRGPPREKKA